MGTTIFLQSLRVRARIGVHPRERRRRQPLWIQVSLEALLPEVGRVDSLESTVDYSALHDRIRSLVLDSSYQLLESLAHRLARACLEDTRVRRAEVTVRKPRALPGAAVPGVTVGVERDG